ncbi:hypothetical protein AVEN_21350-1 [Araneus ventricosus]|uniref:Uncharacterized protein n=1 Tax=Araneus ventricosus TaxID=182803 RepID=A0A4Y2SCQ0_ARAVE|nr:hypothetical protein AVEN_21350-1 [Araneus ventricosus]
MTAHDGKPRPRNGFRPINFLHSNMGLHFGTGGHFCRRDRGGPTDNCVRSHYLLETIFSDPVRHTLEPLKINNYPKLFMTNQTTCHFIAKRSMERFGIRHR